MTISYSVVITTYNGEKTLSACVQSAINQNIKANEIIIIDDCSVDGTSLVVNLIMQEYSFVKYFKTTTNSGPGFARNYGVKLCKNDQIIFYDDDDVSFPSRSDTHLKQLANSDLSYVSSIKFYGNNYELEFVNSPFKGLIELKSIAQHLILGKYINGTKIYVPASTLAVNKDFFLKIGGFDNTLKRLEDVDFALRAAEHNAIFSFDNKILVKRFHTMADDKNANVESKSQISILFKHRHLLSNKDFKQILIWYKIRESYFLQNYARTIRLVLIYAFKYQSYKNFIKIGLNRLKHDKKIRNSKND
jgi:glycosyltransferase involved in cell wall biosynthesis